MATETPAGELTRWPITAERVGVRVDQTWLLREVSFGIAPATVTAIAGPNGAGKSTLLSVLAGDRRPTEGGVLLGQTSPYAIPPRQLARIRSVMAQDHRIGFAFSVGETVRLGRHAYPVRPDLDAELVDEALRTADITHLRHRDVTTLSGGESARTAYARVRAQDAPIVFLDEPTAALDLRHQELLMRSAREAADLGRTVIAVVHDLNLVTRYADQVLVLDGGYLAGSGSPAEVLTAAMIERVYGHPVHILSHPDTGAPVIVPRQPAEEAGR